MSWAPTRTPLKTRGVTAGRHGALGELHTRPVDGTRASGAVEVECRCLSVVQDACHDAQRRVTATPQRLEQNEVVGDRAPGAVEQEAKAVCKFVPSERRRSAPRERDEALVHRRPASHGRELWRAQGARRDGSVRPLAACRVTGEWDLIGERQDRLTTATRGLERYAMDSAADDLAYGGSERYVLVRDAVRADPIHPGVLTGEVTVFPVREEPTHDRRNRERLQRGSIDDACGRGQQVEVDAATEEECRDAAHVLQAGGVASGRADRLACAEVVARVNAQKEPGEPLARDRLHPMENVSDQSGSCGLSVVILALPLRARLDEVLMRLTDELFI